ncbi:MAG: efflux transporter outer membrane subunit [Gemmatimonadota bacterium]|nr:efflux transporter outer membrane subunit [Gemmatimonadota bacterium]
MRMIYAILTASTLFLSCASAPKRQSSPVKNQVPNAWTAGSTISDRQSIKVDWWRDFQDTQLDSLITNALKYNYNLKAAAQRVQAARAQATIVGAPLFPQVSLGLNGAKRHQNFIGFPIPGSGGGGVLSTTATTYGVSTNLNWEIDLWGRLRNDKAAALADYQGAQADHLGARLSLSGQTTKAWFAAIEARRQMDLAQSTRDNFQAVNDQIQTRYESGLRPPLDLRLSLSNVATAEAVVAQRRQQYDGSVRQLEILLGRYPAAELAIAQDLLPMPAPIPAGLPADLIARRPDLMIAERQVAAANARVKVAKRARYPSISLTSSGGTSSANLSNLLSGDFIVWSFAGNLLQPLFQGGRLRAGIKLAEANQEQALAGFAEQALRAYGEVESALMAETYLRDRENALREASEQAVAARELAENRYTRGVSDVITLLGSQRRAFEAEGQYLTVRRQRLDARVDLYLALGGGFGEID